MSLSAPSVRVVFYTSNDEQAKEHSVDIPSHCVTRAGWLEMCPPSARDVIEQAGADASSTDIIRSGQLDKVLSRDAHMHFLLHAMLCAFYDNAQLVDDNAKKLHREQHVEQFVGFFTAGTAATKISNQMYAYAELLRRRSTVPGILDFCPASHFKEAKSALMQSPQLRQVLLDRALDIAVPLEQQIQQEAAALEQATLALQTSDAESKQPETHETSRKLRRPKQDKSHLLSSRATKEQHQQALKALRAKKLNATTIKTMSEDILHENPFVSQLRTIYHHDGELYYDYDRDDGSIKPAVGRTTKKQDAADHKRVGDRKSTSAISYIHLRRPERNHAKIDEFHDQLYRDHVTCLGQNDSEIVIVWKQHVSWVVSEQVLDQLGWRQHCAWLRGDSEPVVEAQLGMSRLQLSPQIVDEPSEDELKQRLREMERQIADVRAQLERKRRAPPTTRPDEKENQQPALKKCRSGISLRAETAEGEPEYAERIDEAFRICSELGEQVEGEWIRAVLIVLNLRLSQTDNSARLVFLSSWYGMSSYTVSGDTQPNDERSFNLPIDTCDFLAAPLHINNNHWVLAVLDRRNNVVYGLDSKRHLERSHVEVEKLAEYGQASDDWTYKTVDVTLQQDDVSCGLFVLRYAFYMASNADWLDTISQQQFNVAHMMRRLRMLSQSWKTVTLAQLNVETDDDDDVMDIDNDNNYNNTNNNNNHNNQGEDEQEQQPRHIVLDTYLHTDFFSKSDADRWLTELNSDIQYLPRDQLKYRGNKLARDKAFYCDIVQDSVVFYQYPGSRRDVWKPWSAKTKELRDVLVAKTDNKTLNSVVGNAYQNENDNIGAHNDKPEDIQTGTSIVTVSLGYTRTLRLQRQDGKEQPIDIPLSHGSVFVLGWETNKKYTPAA